LGSYYVFWYFFEQKLRVNKSAYFIIKVVEDETLQPLRVK